MSQILHLPAHLAIERELIPGRTWLVRDARSGESLIAKKSPIGGLRGRWRALAERAGDALEVERELFSREGFTLTLRAFLEGRPLRESRGALQQNDAVALLLAVASRVAALHRKGVVHGNLHSGNAIVGGDGTVRLVDALEQGRRAADSVCASPEQLRGEPATARSDLYALGGIAFELLTGRPAFPGTDLDAIRRALYEAPSFAGLSADGARVLGKALAKDPAQRPGSAEQLAADLHTLAPVARGPTTRLVARSLRSWLGLLGRSLRDRGGRLARVPRAAWVGLLIALAVALWTTRFSLGFSEDATLRREVEATLTASDTRRARRLLAAPPPRARVETLEKLRGDVSCADAQPVECLQQGQTGASRGCQLGAFSR